MRKTIPYLVLYGVYILATTFVLFALRQVFFVLLLLLLLILPIITILSFLRAYNTLLLTAACEAETVEEGNQIRIRVEAQSQALLPVLSCKICFRVENLFYKNSKEYQLSFPILPKKLKELTIPIETSRPGLVQVIIDRVIMTDLLHLYQKEKNLDLMVTVPVLPIVTTPHIVIPTSGEDGTLEYTEADYRGTLSSDVKEIREYRPGDRLQRIHWKLSAKLQDIYVKEMEYTSTMSLLLLPEMTKRVLPDTLRTFYSLCKDLIKRQERFQVCLYQHTRCEFQYIPIVNEDSFYECYLRLCQLPVYEEEELSLISYKNACSEAGIVAHIRGTTIEFPEWR